MLGREEHDLAQRVARLEHELVGARGILRREERATWKLLRPALSVALVVAVAVPMLAYALDPIPEPPEKGQQISASFMNQNFDHLVAGVTAVESRFVSASAPAISAAIPDFVTSSQSFVDVPGLSVDLTTSGNPVIIQLVPGTGADLSSILINDSGSSVGANLQLIRDGAPVCGVTMSLTAVSGQPQLAAPPSILTCVDDTPPADASYSVRVQLTGANLEEMTIANVRLIAYELGWVQ